jgi:predicted amidohydrolase
MQDLTVTLVQTELVWEDIDANLAMLDHKLDGIETDTDLIILPEMFTTGFSMNAPKLAQGMDGSAVAWMLKTAAKKNADITGSIIIQSDGKYFNRLIWARPNGKLFTYDKRHTFRMLDEHKVYSPGDRNMTVALKGWKIRPFICYDLRFPVWSRNIDNQYDLAVFVANWPEKRALHWKSLLTARAIENQCFIVAVNRVGTDGNGNAHSGDSSVIDPLGDILFQKTGEEALHTATLSHDVLETFREDFPAWMDADRDIVNLP